MTLPFENKMKLLSYLFLWIFYAMLHTVSFYQVMDMPLGILAVDGCIHALLFGVFGILLWNVFQYGKFDSLPFFQRLLNYGALAIFTVSLWVGIGFFVEYLCFDLVIIETLSHTLLLKALLGLLIYLIVALTFRSQPQSKEQEEPAIIEPEEPIVEENTEKELLERIAVKIGQKIHVIAVSDIYYFQSYGDYVQIITEKDKFIKEQTMKYFETNLPVHQFVRIHRSYIVNVEAISRIESHVKQNQLIILKNGDQLKVSAAGYKILKTALNL
ncbi:LytTR family transcriptional regulator DNA-binding domain-containing protein [Bacteroidales bacterium OttesenSCG-928-C19]|nr:LytTR family transcriptional regulator DNA-binding domain-containing protein [Bacteroidales bacterium OttesenSCG-928-C19]